MSFTQVSNQGTGIVLFAFEHFPVNSFTSHVPFSIPTTFLKICSSSLTPFVHKVSAFSLWSHSDNTAGIRTQRSGFNRHEQNVYFLPILVVDSGPPSLSSTGTLTIHVCGCDTGEKLLEIQHHYVTLSSLSPCSSSWKGHLCHCLCSVSDNGDEPCGKSTRLKKINKQKPLVFTFVSPD